MDEAQYEPGTDNRSNRQVETFEASNGAEGHELRGRPIVVVTMLGAKSGKLRKIPVMRVEHDGEYAVFASRGGSPENPAWYGNLVANPRVRLQDGAASGDYLAAELEGDEREVWWARGVEAWPDYANYALKTSRLIPVFLLTPVD
jgi:deazaflavin-dependent oxidoreductase (nitroreductase family)